MEWIAAPTPRPRILIADPDQDAADVLSMQLARCGCDTRHLPTLKHLTAEALS